VAQPGGGSFVMSVSTNGGPWGGLVTLDGYSAVPAGRFTNIVVPPDRYRLGADGVAGTNIILGPHVQNSQGTGVHVAYVSSGGIALSQVTNVPVAIRGPVFQGLAPDLLVWHMKEDGTEATRNALEECEAWWSAWVPKCDVIYIGTPYNGPLNGGEAASVAQNQVVRSVALERGRTYMDCMTPGISYAWLDAHGYMSDGVHLSYSGGWFFANLMWNDLGFFAMGLDHRLWAGQDGNGPWVMWNTGTGAIYDIEASSDLSNWKRIFSRPGDGSTIVLYDFSPAAKNFFRLRFRPQ
jgi:hypothetical protein